MNKENLVYVEEGSKKFKDFLKENVNIFFTPNPIKIGNTLMVGCTLFIDGGLDKKDTVSCEFFVPLTSLIQ